MGSLNQGVTDIRIFSDTNIRSYHIRIIFLYEYIQIFVRIVFLICIYSDICLRFDTGVIIIQLLAEHESHGRPILDAGLLEQFLREFPLLSQDFAHRNHTI